MERTKSEIFRNLFAPCSSSSSRLKFLPLIVLAAFVVRTIAVQLSPTPFPFPDSLDYDAIANNILSGKGFVLKTSHASRAPLYPIFVAGCYWVGGGVWMVKMAQALLGSLLVVPLYFFVLHLSKDRKVAYTAAAWLALDPLQIAFCALLLTETLATCLLFLAIWSTYLAGSRQSHRWAAFGGAMFAAATLCRSGLLLLILPLALYVAVVKKARLSLLLSMSLSFLLVLSPWAIRNWSVFHKFVPVTTKLGVNLYEALGPGATGAPRMDQMQLPPSAQDLSEIERDLHLRQWTFHYVRQHSLEAFALIGNKALRFWNVSLNYAPLRRHPLNWGIILFSTALYLAALWGVRWMPRRHLLLLLLPVVYVASLHMVFIGSVRYRVPILPFLEIIAAYGVVHGYSKRTL